jgi:8-oxo-dGTP pyrophosphatase MutT (NUDIX family)
MSPETGLSNNGPEESERWLSTASISVLLSYGAQHKGLIFVQNAEKWGLPAGGLKRHEYLLDGLRREIQEETQIGPDKVYFHNKLTRWDYTPSGPSFFQLAPILTITIPKEDKTKVGQIFNADYVGPRLPKVGWVVEGDEKVGLCKPFSLDDILELLDAHYSKGETIYKPEFNAIAIVHHVLNSTSKEDYIGKRSSYPQRVNKILEKIWLKTDFLRLIHTEAPFKEDHWLLNHPSLGGTQNPDAHRRKYGYKWGP